MNEMAAPEGVIIGGWLYVILAYSITGSGLLFYALSLALRLHRAKQED